MILNFCFKKTYPCSWTCHFGTDKYSDKRECNSKYFQCVTFTELSETYEICSFPRITNINLLIQ